MSAKKYVICDIEATGLDADCEMIEIALITYQDEKVIDVYETLINPLRTVPEYITNLTLISNRELQEAPKFYEVAESIRQRIEGAVFVSHNIEFDLGLLKRKYKEMGEELKIKSFCTLKVAQQEIPGLKNYNLDALCSFFHIKITDRHRAIGDAKATLALFKELLQLRFKVYPKILFLPHHERALKNIPAQAGLLRLKDEKGKVLRYEATFDMKKRAMELLAVTPDNRELLSKTESLESEVTGSALIAEFKKLGFVTNNPHWVIQEVETDGEKNFRIRPYKKGRSGHWYFQDYFDARKKLRLLEKELKGETFIYREGGKSKEEIVRHNQKVEALSKEAKFPSDHLVLVGQGRTLGEKSVVLIRHQHVVGYGYTMDSSEEIFANPEAFLNKRYFQHLGADLVAKQYIRVLKNVRHKTEGWRSLSESFTQ